jgi:hypothetical protein
MRRRQMKERGEEGVRAMRGVSENGATNVTTIGRYGDE